MQQEDRLVLYSKLIAVYLPTSIQEVKPLAWLVAVSLVANAILLAIVLRHPSTPPAPAIVDADGTAASDAPAKDRNQALRAALASGDPTALAAADCPPEIIRSLAVGRAYLKQQEHLRALQTKFHPDDHHWWRNINPASSAATLFAKSADIGEINREFRNEIRQALGDDPAVLSGSSISLLSFLPVNTCAQLQRIDEDYSDLLARAYAEAGNVRLPSDTAKQNLLEKERERDIASLLGPELYEQYLLRNSPSAMAVRIQYGNAIQTEEEYRQIYALQKAFDDRFSTAGMSPADSAATQQVRLASLQELQQQIAVVLGPERYQEAQRANDPEYRTLTALAKRLNLTSGTVDSVYASLNTYATQSQQINVNPTLTQEDRMAQLRALAVQAEARLQQTLGQEAAQAYVQRIPWLRALKNGSAFATGTANAAGNGNPPSQKITIVPPPRN